MTQEELQHLDKVLSEFTDADINNYTPELAVMLIETRLKTAQKKEAGGFMGSVVAIIIMLILYYYNSH